MEFMDYTGDVGVVAQEEDLRGFFAQAAGGLFAILAELADQGTFVKG